MLYNIKRISKWTKQIQYKNFINLCRIIKIIWNYQNRFVYLHQFSSFTGTVLLFNNPIKNL
jgi:hypothetical protein